VDKYIYTMLAKFDTYCQLLAETKSDKTRDFQGVFD